MRRRAAVENLLLAAVPVALTTPMERRAQLEVALLGNEGMLCVSLILGRADLSAPRTGPGAAGRHDGWTPPPSAMH